MDEVKAGDRNESGKDEGHRSGGRRRTEKRWRSAKTVLNTADDDSFTHVPIMFGWLDPDEQRIRGTYLEQVSEEEYPEVDELYPPTKGPARIIPRRSEAKGNQRGGKTRSDKR